jgi:hypothetical protein
VCGSDAALQTEEGAEVDGRSRCGGTSSWPESAPTCSSAPTSTVQASELVIRACDFDAALLRLARVHRQAYICYACTYTRVLVAAHLLLCLY